MAVIPSGARGEPQPQARRADTGVIPSGARRELASWRGAALDVSCIAAAFALALGLFLSAELRIAGEIGLAAFPLDDSWIHLHFARNLAEGRGFSYNPGVPVAGSTAPLWTLLLAGVFRLAGSAPAWAKALGVAATFGAALVTRRLVWTWTDSRLLALAGGLAVVVSGPLVWAALSGMEVALAALLVTGALLAHVTHRDVTAALLLGLAVVTRPEAVLMAPLLWIAGPLTLRRSAVLGGIIALLVAPWLVFNLRTAGTPLPATASAKIEGGLIGFLSGVRESARTALVSRPWEFEVEWARWLFSVDALLPILALLGLWGLWRRNGRRAVWPAAALVLHPLGMALLAPYRGPAFQEGRYSIHLLPLAIAVALACVAAVSVADGKRGLLPVVLAGLFLVGALWNLPAAATRYAWAVQNIEAMQVRLGQWIAANTPARARLALNDVGAIAYLSRREVVDVMGLVTPAIIPYRRHGEQGVLAYLERTCPDYLVIFPDWFPALSAMADRFTPIHQIRLDHNTVAGADLMVVYETPWNRWKRAAPCAGPVSEDRPRSPVFQERPV